MFNWLNLGIVFIGFAVWVIIVGIVTTFFFGLEKLYMLFGEATNAFDKIGVLVLSTILWFDLGITKVLWFELVILVGLGRIIWVLLGSITVVLLLLYVFGIVYDLNGNEVPL